MERLKKALDSLIGKRISPVLWLTGFLGIIMTRLFFDKFVARTSSPLFDFVMDIHNILFFGLTFLSVWLVISLILRRNPFDLSYLMLFASFFIILPPIFDLLRTGGEVYWSFYLISAPKELFWQFITVFGHLPSGIVYFGTKITFVLAIILLASMVFLKTKSLLKAIFSAISVYLCLFLMAAFPSILAYMKDFIAGNGLDDIRSFEIIQFFSGFKILGVELSDITYSLAYNLNFVYFLLVLGLLVLFFWQSERKKFISVVKNMRYPQLIYHLGLFFGGLGLGYWVYPQDISYSFFEITAILSLILSIVFSWEASVIINDLNDTEIDKITNKERPLPSGVFSREEYWQLGKLILFLAILGGFLINYKLGWLLVAYQFLAWFYSGVPMRFKRFPVIATMLSALASLIVLMMGFILFSPNQDLAGFPWRIFALLFITYTISLPLKDLKDIPGDKKDGVWTIPVIFGEDKGRTIIGASFFISYILSVFFLNEWRLFWWSLIFGSVSFLVINNKKIAPRRLLWWNLGIVFVYGVILVKIVFLAN